jgi:hypothetical protein
LVRRPTGLSENIADRGGDSAVAEPFTCPAGWPMYAAIMLSRPRILPAGFSPPCLPIKAPRPPSGALWLRIGVGLEGIVSKPEGLAYRSGRSPDWLKSKNPACAAVKREAEEDWGK